MEHISHSELAQRATGQQMPCFWFFLAVWLHLLGFSGSYLCQVLCCQDPKVSIFKLNSIKDAAEAFDLGFFLKRNSVVNFLLSLLLLLFQGISFFSLPFNGCELLCGPKQDTRAALSLCWLLSCDLFAFVSNLFSIPLCINPEFSCRNGYD